MSHRVGVLSGVVVSVAGALLAPLASADGSADAGSSPSDALVAVVSKCVDESAEPSAERSCVSASVYKTCREPTVAAPSFDEADCMRRHRATSVTDTSGDTACETERLEQQQRDRAAATAHHDACETVLKSKMEAYLTASTDCQAHGQISHCRALDPSLGKTCAMRCAEIHDQAVQTEIANARVACIERYVEASGKGTFRCELPLAAQAPPPGFDVNAELNRVLEAHDDAALDALVVKSDAATFRDALPGCTKTCPVHGRNRLEALTDGPGLVTAYKRCMVDADSTREARKLEAFEHDLYCQHMSAANTQCRKANRCDWLEAYGTVQCFYSSGGEVQTCGF